MFLETQIKEVKLTGGQWNKINILIDSSLVIGQHIYPFNRPVYDEDAGVYTDYGTNDNDRTWAQIHFRSLMAMAVVHVIDRSEYDANWQDRPVTVYLIEHALPVLVQAIHTVYSANALADQKREARQLIDGIYRNRATHLWESDGHYGPDSKDDFTKIMIENEIIDRKEGRELIEKLEKAKSVGNIRRKLQETVTK